MAANEGSKYTNFSNISIGTATAAGELKIKGVVTNLGLAASSTIAAAATLTAADSGKTYYMDAAAGKTITLPAVTTAGMWFKFMVASTFITTNWIIDSAEGDNIDGSITVAGVVVVAAAEDMVNFAFGAEALGDHIIIESDGVQWFVNGTAALTGGITATDPS